MRGKHFINRRYPPVAFISLYGEVSDADQIAHLNELLELARADLAKGTRWVVIVDSRYTAPSSATQRKQLSAFLNEHSDLVRAASLAHVFIVDSMIVRGGITALRWLGALPREIQTVASYPEAIARARAELQAASGPQIPAALLGPDGEKHALGELHEFARSMKQPQAAP